MNKLLKNIIGALVLVVIVIFFYLLTFQIQHKKLVVSETKAIISIGSLDSRKMNSYYELYEKATNEDTDEARSFAKYIKGADLIYFDDPINKDEKKENMKEIVALNIGWMYPIAKFKQREYFDDLGKNYFSLKDEYQKELEEKYGIENKIYMTNYKGYYFISDDVMKLSDYLRLIVKKGENKNITSKMKGNTLGEAVIDLSGINEELTALKINLDYKDNESILNGYIYGDIEFSKYFDGLDSKDRKFKEYMGENRIYLTNNDFKGLTKFIREHINSKLNSTLSLIKMFTGKDIEDYMDDINGEIVYDYKENQIILPVKNPKNFEKLIKMFGKKDGDLYTLNNGNFLEIKDNVIYYNGIMEKGNMTPKKDEFIDASLNLGLYNPMLEDIYVEMGGKVEKSEIKLRATIKDEELLKMYDRMEAKEND